MYVRNTRWIENRPCNREDRNRNNSKNRSWPTSLIRLLFAIRIEIVVQSIAIKKQFFKLISPSSCRIRSNCLVSFVFFFFFLWWRWLFRFDRFGLFPRDSFVLPPLLSQRMEIYLRVKTVFRNVCLLMVGGLGIDTPKVDIKWLLFFESWKFFMVRKLKNIIILISSL